MECDTYESTSCAVSGLLYSVLLVSRAAGLAPLSFTRERSGWCARLAPRYCAYNYLVLITLIIFYGVFVAGDRDDVVDGYEPASNTGFMRVVMLGLFTLFVLTGAAVLLTSARRTRSLVHCTARLNQINAEMDRLFHLPPESEKIMYPIMIVSMIYGYFTVSFYFGLYLKDVIAANDTVPLVSYSFGAVFLSTLQLQQFALQFCVLAMRLVATQRRLNCSLTMLLQKIRSALLSKSKKEILVNIYTQIPKHSNTYVIDALPVIVRGGLKTVPETLDQLIHVYCSLCGIMRQLNDSNGIALVALALYMLMNFVTTPYFVVAMIFRTHTQIPVLKSLCQLAWCILCFGLVVMITEPCHRAHVELSLTKGLVQQMMRHTRQEALAVKYELKMFLRHILLNPVSFAPMQLLTLDRTLPVAVLSTTVTYLSVVIRL